jgi:hypothetical protein
MPRPHCEFIHAQQLKWQAAAFPGEFWRGIETKTLSSDAASGACSLLLRIPVGKRAADFVLTAQSEWFVLDGEFQLDGETFGLDCYTCLPAWWPLRDFASGGAVVLAFFASLPGAEAHSVATPQPDVSLRVPRIDTHNTPWTSHDIDPSVQFLRLSHKVLRQHPTTGERTILLATGAQTHPAEWREAQLRHDCVEEMYLLGGDIIGERGVMYEGAYFWRPGGIWHGPFGSRRGSLSIIRFAEGRHANEWGAEKLPFTLTPQHAPEVPPQQGSAHGAWTPPRW